MIKFILYLMATIALLSGVSLKVVVANHHIAASKSKQEVSANVIKTTPPAVEESNKQMLRIASPLAVAWGVASLIAYAGLLLGSCRRNAVYVGMLIINLILILIPVRWG